MAPSLTLSRNTHTHLPIPGKYKYILCCCSKAITNMAISLANKSRTCRSSLDCQQNKSRTWQSHMPAQSADKQKPIGVCVCALTHFSSMWAPCYLKHRTTDVHHLFLLYFFFTSAHSAPRDERLSEDNIYGAPSSLSTVISFWRGCVRQECQSAAADGRRGRQGELDDVCVCVRGVIKTSAIGG